MRVFKKFTQLSVFCQLPEHETKAKLIPNIKALFFGVIYANSKRTQTHLKFSITIWLL